MMGKFSLAILRFTLIFIFTLGLVGCPEIPNKSLREQVRDAEKASGYNSDPAIIEKNDEVNMVRARF
ncbi:hypothetical protein JEM67_00020 (plasmid) [Serratia sp. PAMC26656]|uniref:hypothetical protein n=1 Tax=Serratia sp. PAMC26656 TaxID=2775909 RepID=UPI0018F72876|nr:hypothetical protein [Serratia sp. PAMC26656]MBJ7889489.1 hypothetical protein [Serratia sp. PAMC26656]